MNLEMMKYLFLGVFPLDNKSSYYIHFSLNFLPRLFFMNSEVLSLVLPF